MLNYSYNMFTLTPLISYRSHGSSRSAILRRHFYTKVLIGEDSHSTRRTAVVYSRILATRERANSLYNRFSDCILAPERLRLIL